jgi:phosphinothricin acetyltransferase
MDTIRCDRSHAPAILAILNDAIVNTTAVWDYVPRPASSMAQWFEQKEARDFPVIGAVDGATLCGFATYGTFRAWPGYKYSVEHSVYVDAKHRRRGVGKALVEELLRHAERQQYHTMIGGIAADNLASLRLHEQLGFVHCGVVRQAGYKFDRWLDLVLMQYLLRTPARPTAD